MKKRDEGYVLAFVLVVIVVICLISVSMMTASLQNLKSQTASVERMEQKYKAQGEMEKVVNTIDWDGWLSEINAGSDLEAVLKNYFKPLDADQDVSVTVSMSSEVKSMEVVLDVQVSPEGDPYKVNAKLKWTANVPVNFLETIPVDPNLITNEKLVYTAYEVTAVEPTPVSGEVG